MAEVVPEKARTAAYALDMCFESIVASFGPPVVGILAERVFGYQPRTASGGAADRENAAALGKAVFVEIAVPATICCLVYLAMYWTYPTDRRRARMILEEASGGDRENSGFEARGPNVASAADDGFNQALLPRLAA